MFKNRYLHFTAKLYGYFISAGENLQSLFLLWMRMTWGHQFMLTGSGKLANIEKVIQYFTSLGLPYPDFQAHLVGYIELIGGILMLVGFCSRIVGVVLAFTMIVALSSAEHASMLSEFRFIFEPSTLVGEAPYPFLITSLLLFFFGPGRLSIDAWIKRWVDKQPKY
jgi:putative oxidoreductase